MLKFNVTGELLALAVAKDDKLEVQASNNK